MGKPFILLEFENSRRLTFGNVYPLVYGLNEFVLPINKFIPSKLCWHKAVCQENRFFRTRFFTQAAENAAKHVNFVFGGILFLPIEVFFALLPFGRLHCDGFGGTRDGAKAAGRAALSALFIAL